MERQGDDGVRDKFRNPNSAIRNRMTILNVDDDDASRYAISHILRQAGFEVIEAANGAETLQLVKENPDLVILDVNLPDMNGFEVCRRIKADPATSLMPVLMLSATYRDDQSRVKGLDSGGDGYLTHPVEPLVLIATVKALLRIRQAETELQAAAREWRTTFDAIGDAVSLMDLEGRMLRCNEAMTKLLGKPFNEIIGRTCGELSHPELDSIEGSLLTRLREGRREAVDLPVGERWFHVTMDPLLDEDGNFIGAVHIMSDITERVRAEAALRESEERFRTIFESAPIGISMVNAEGKPLQTNRTFQEMFSSTEDELRSMVFLDYTHPDDAEDSLRQFRALLEGESDYLHTEKRYYAKDGHLIWAQVVASTVRDANGQFQYIIAMVEDITERKRAEEALWERMKELTCLYAVHRDMQEDLPTDELCRRVVEHLVSAMEFPEITVPVIELDGKRFTSEGYTEGLSHGLQAEIRVEGKARGHLWVYYAKDRPFSIPEQQNLLNAIAEALGVWLEHKWAEEALRESEERLFAFMNAAYDYFVIYDKDFRLVEIDEKAVRNYGVPKEDLIGKSLEELAPDSIKTDRLEKYKEVVSRTLPINITNSWDELEQAELL